MGLQNLYREAVSYKGMAVGIGFAGTIVSMLGLGGVVYWPFWNDVIVVCCS